MKFNFLKKQTFNSKFTKIYTSPYSRKLALLSPKQCLIINHNLSLLYKIKDENNKEYFQSCIFLKFENKNNFYENNQEFICLFGDLKYLKIISLINTNYYILLKGHGGKIIDVKRHPLKNNLIFSCSADTSIRLWDLKTKKTLKIFGGLNGHEDLVLSIDISSDGKFLVSGGSDNTIKVWKISNLNNNELERINFPIYSNQVLHKTYINYLSFCGKVILSKNVSNRVSIFAPEILFVEENQKIVLENKNKVFLENNNISNIESKETGLLHSKKNKNTKKEENMKKEERKENMITKTIVINEKKFEEKILHKFCYFENFIIIFTILGNCYFIKKNNFEIKNENFKILNIKDFVIFKNFMFVIVDNQIVEKFRIEE